MNYIDTHSHLYLNEFKNDREEIISRALGAGVAKILLPNIDKASVSSMLEMAYSYPGICYPMIGIHPTSVNEDYVEQLESVKEWLSKESFIAIGEIGIDLYWEKKYIKQQSEIFKAQLELALSNKLPVVIHARDSFKEIFSLLEEYRGSGLREYSTHLQGIRVKLSLLWTLGFISV